MKKKNNGQISVVDMRKFIFELVCKEHTRNSALSGRDEKEYTKDHEKFVNLLKHFEKNYSMDVITLFNFLKENKVFEEYGINC